MGTQLPRTVPPKRLAQSITSASLTMQLTDILDWDGATNLAAGNFGTQLFAMLQNDTRTRVEIVEIDPATIASTPITLLKRGLSLDGAQTEVTANKLDWGANETIVQMGTHVPTLLYQYVDLARDQTITGMKTVSTPTAAGHAANKAYVDATVNGGAVSHDQTIVAGVAGETLVSGDLVYFSDGDNEWMKVDADTAATVNNVMLGIAQGAGTDGNSISGGVLVHGLDTTHSGMTVGALYYASNTAGGISTTTGTTEKVIGFAKSATELYFDPFFYYTPTAVQKASIVSTNISLFTYGETITAGEAVYLKSSDQKVYKADSDAAASTYTFLGFAYQSGVLNDSKLVQTAGLVTGLSGLTAGTVYYLSSTAGALSSSVGTYGFEVGVALSTTSLYMTPRRSGGIPKTTVYTNIFGSSTTQFDITNTAGTTYRYTFDGTGTDPVISTTTVPTGTVLVVAAQNFTAANNGTFVVTGSGANYFEVTNASGVVESNKTLGTGTIKYGYQKPDGLRYIHVEVLGGGGGGVLDSDGGGSGCYARGVLAASLLGTTETLTIGAGGTSTNNGGSSSIGSLVIAGGGQSAVTGGTLSGSATAGFVAISSNGGAARSDAGPTPDFQNSGSGGGSPFGTGGTSCVSSTAGAGASMNGNAGRGYGAGGSGSINGAAAAGAGTQGLIIITEHF